MQFTLKGNNLDQFWNPVVYITTMLWCTMCIIIVHCFHLGKEVIIIFSSCWNCKDRWWVTNWLYSRHGHFDMKVRLGWEGASAVRVKYKAWVLVPAVSVLGHTSIALIPEWSQRELSTVKCNKSINRKLQILYWLLYISSINSRCTVLVKISISP